MNKILMVFILITAGYFMSFGQASKNVHQLFAMKEGIEKLNISLPPSDIQIKKVKGSRIRVEVTIKLETPNLNLLEYMINQGRYQLVQETNSLETELTIKLKENKNIIIIKGKECKENLSYTIYVPESIRAVNHTCLTTGEQVVLSMGD